MKNFNKSYDGIAATAKEILEKKNKLSEGSKLEDMILYSGPTGLFAKKVAKVITDNDPAAVFVPGMNTRDGVAMQRILLDYIHGKMGTNPKEKFGPYFDGVDLVGPGADGKTLIRGALDPKNKVKIKDLIKALKDEETYRLKWASRHSEEAEVTISVDSTSLIESLRAGKGKTTIDADYVMGDQYFTNVAQRQFKIKIKKTGFQTADITGEKKDIIAFLQSDDYGLDDDDIKDLFPELLESLTEAQYKMTMDSVSRALDLLSNALRKGSKLNKEVNTLLGGNYDKDFKTMKDSIDEVFNTYEDIRYKAIFGIKESAELTEVTISVDLADILTEKLRAGKGKTTVDADYIADKYFTNVAQRQFKIKIKPTSSSTADITGEKKDIIAFLQSDDYGLDDRHLKDLFPELLS